MAKPLSKEVLEIIIQNFYDEAFTDEEFQKLLTDMEKVQLSTGLVDPIIMDKVFEHLDKKLQSRIKDEIK